MHTAWFWTTIGFYVNTELAFGRFDRVIDLAGRNVEAFGNDQEVMNQCVHMTLHRFTIRQHDFRRVRFHWSRLQTRERLRRDLVRLFHLAHADHVPRPDVAIGFGRHLKIVVLVTAVGICTANIEVDAAATQTWTRESPVNRIFSGDLADALSTALKD